MAEPRAQHAMAHLQVSESKISWHIRENSSLLKKRNPDYMFLLLASTWYYSAFWIYSLMCCLFWCFAYPKNHMPELVNWNWIYFESCLSSSRNLLAFFVFLAAMQQIQLFRWSSNLKQRDYDSAFVAVHMHDSDKSRVGEEIRGVSWKRSLWHDLSSIFNSLS